MTLLWVALGGAAGSALRFALGRRFDADGRHPGTLLANTAASLLLGVCAGASLDGAALALVGTGFCGGLSTYSSFAVQTRDVAARSGASALAYATLTLALGLAACSLGFLLAR